MDKEVLAIIDTAIKIGLGATIGAIGSILLFHLSKKKEIELESGKMRTKIFLENLDLINKYIQAIGEFLAICDGIAKKRTETQNVEVKWHWLDDIDKKIVESRNDASNALLKLSICARKSLREEIEPIIIFENKMRTSTRFKKDEEFLNQIEVHKSSFSDIRGMFTNNLLNIGQECLLLKKPKQ